MVREYTFDAGAVLPLSSWWLGQPVTNQKHGGTVTRTPLMLSCAEEIPVVLWKFPLDIEDGVKRIRIK